MHDITQDDTGRAGELGITQDDAGRAGEEGWDWDESEYDEWGTWRTWEDWFSVNFFEQNWKCCTQNTLEMLITDVTKHASRSAPEISNEPKAEDNSETSWVWKSLQKQSTASPWPLLWSWLQPQVGDPDFSMYDLFVEWRIYFKTWVGSRCFRCEFTSKCCWRFFFFVVLVTCGWCSSSPAIRALVAELLASSAREVLSNGFCWRLTCLPVRLVTGLYKDGQGTCDPLV